MGTMVILSLCKGMKGAEKPPSKLVGEVREKWGRKNGFVGWMEEFQLKLSISRSSFFWNYAKIQHLWLKPTSIFVWITSAMEGSTILYTACMLHRCSDVSA